MNNAFKVMKFEFSSIVMKKKWVITTVIMMIIILLLSIIPAIINALSQSSDEESNGSKEVRYGIIINNAFEYSEFDDRFVKYDDKAALEKDVLSQKLKSGIIIDGEKDYSIVLKDQALNDSGAKFYKSYIKNVLMNRVLHASNIDIDKYESLKNYDASPEYIFLGKNLIGGFVMSYSLTLFLYMGILFYGQNLAIRIANEKATKTTEILITTIKSKEIILGKILGIGFAGLFQLILFALAAFVSLSIAQYTYNFSITDMINASAIEIIEAFVLFILGYFIYISLFAAAGSIVSKTEELSDATSPITLVCVVSFLASMFLVNNPNPLILNVLSFVPLTSPFAGIINLFMNSDFTIYLQFATIAVQIITFFLIYKLSASIYRSGSLYYGNSVSIFKFTKDMFAGK